MSDNASISSDTSSPAPEDVKLRPSKVAEKETASLQILFDLMKKFTPHIKGTFVLEKNWWDLNAENPGIHVRLLSILAAPPLMIFYSRCSSTSSSEQPRRP